MEDRLPYIEAMSPTAWEIRKKGKKIELTRVLAVWASGLLCKTTQGLVAPPPSKKMVVVVVAAVEVVEVGCRKGEEGVAKKATGCGSSVTGYVRTKSQTRQTESQGQISWVTMSLSRVLPRFVG